MPEKMMNGMKMLYNWSYHKFYIDEVYLFVTKKIIFNNIARPVAWFDRHIVDGTMNGIAWVTNAISVQIKGFQSGQIQKYGYVFISGVIILAFVFVYYWFKLMIKMDFLTLLVVVPVLTIVGDTICKRSETNACDFGHRDGHTAYPRHCPDVHVPGRTESRQHGRDALHARIITWFETLNITYPSESTGFRWP